MHELAMPCENFSQNVNAKVNDVFENMVQLHNLLTSKKGANDLNFTKTMFFFYYKSFTDVVKLPYEYKTD